MELLNVKLATVSLITVSLIQFSKYSEEMRRCGKKNSIRPSEEVSTIAKLGIK